jgi:Asp-tRNA(Asn)/Glu-tRNA(Gln) amidotransferase A subunit family amidase
LQDMVAEALIRITTRSEGAPRVGRLRGFFDRRADPAILSMFDDAMRALGAAGAAVKDLADPVNFERVIKDHRTIMAVEAATIHAGDADEFPDDYPPRIRELIDEGLHLGGARHLDIKDRMKQYLEGRLLGATELVEALKRRVVAATDVADALEQSHTEIWITPATIGSAPDPSTTGDPSFNSPWSYTGLPTVSFPIGLSPDGIPVAVQLVGKMFEDFELLRIAQWCEQAIRTWRQ